MELKTCTSCNESKLKDQFHIRRASPDGLTLICKECSKKKHVEYYAKNKEKAKERARKWALENKERRREIAYASDVRRREVYGPRKNDLRKQRWQENLEDSRRKVREAQATRRAAGPLDKAWWEDAKALYTTSNGAVCLYCSEITDKHHMDHFVPISLNGKTVRGNLAPCCKPCNSKKGTRDPLEYFGRKRFDELRLILASL